MKCIVLTCFLLGVATASGVTHSKCSSDKDGYVRVNVIDLKDSIRFPSNVSTDIDIEFLKRIPDGAKVKLQVHRVMWLFGERRVKIPCVKQAGSCEYEFCKFLKEGRGGSSFDLCSLWPQGEKCQCPVDKISLRKSDARLSFPTLSGIAKLLVNGEYAVNAKIIDPSDQKSIFCIDLRATLG
nr:Niemann-Pick type C-2a [Phytoseiulus persimilis]